MSVRPTYHASMAGAFTPPTEADAERSISEVEAYIRSHGGMHRDLSDLAGVDATTFTLFMQRIWPSSWPEVTRIVEALLAQLHAQHRRESLMPVMTPMVMEALGMVKLLREDGGIGLIQGDSGTGKIEAVRAVALRNERAIVVQASTARARPKPMLEDIGQRMGISYYARDTADTYRYVRERLQRFDLLIVDEVHKYIGSVDCHHVLADLLKETGVPQLWTATGDLRRYLDRRTGQWHDPFAQIRSRITRKIDLGEVAASINNRTGKRRPVRVAFYARIAGGDFGRAIGLVSSRFPKVSSCISDYTHHRPSTSYNVCYVKLFFYVVVGACMGQPLGGFGRIGRLAGMSPHSFA